MLLRTGVKKKGRPESLGAAHSIHSNASSESSNGFNHDAAKLTFVQKTGKVCIVLSHILKLQQQVLSNKPASCNLLI